jgi:hypothetical protein
MTTTVTVEQRHIEAVELHYDPTEPYAVAMAFARFERDHLGSTWEGAALAGELQRRLGDGEFYVNGDTFDLIWRPGPPPRNFASLDQIVARMACGETAHWLPSIVAQLLNAALRNPIPTPNSEERT